MHIWYCPVCHARVEVSDRDCAQYAECPMGCASVYWYQRREVWKLGTLTFCFDYQTMSLTEIEALRWQFIQEASRRQGNHSQSFLGNGNWIKFGF